MNKYFENSINFSCGKKFISVAGIVPDRQREMERERGRQRKKQIEEEREIGK